MGDVPSVELIAVKNYSKKFLDAGIQDKKHEYLDSGQIGQIWLTVTEGENGDESDKRI